MGKAIAGVAGAELKLLEVLWERGRSTAREITDSMYSTATLARVATVQKLLQRLEAKRLVRRDRSRHAHAFEATLSRAEFAGRQLERMADRLTDGSVVPLLIHMVRSQKLSKKEKDQIRRLLDH